VDKPSYMVIACAFGAATLLLQNLYSLEIFQYYALPPEVLHTVVVFMGVVFLVFIKLFQPEMEQKRRRCGGLF